MIKQNEGVTDRVIRMVFGVVLLSVAFLDLTGTAKIIVGLVGAVSLITGITGFCALYKIVGISTIEKK